ncbi:SRPBCC family protein [Labrys neptuniae]
MTTAAIEHATFTVERLLPARPRHAFRFFSEPALKQRWTDCHPDWTVVAESFDFRPGGGDSMIWRTGDGEEQTFRAHYFDIVPGERILYGYEMSFAGKKISASLVTVLFTPAGGETRLVFTEQAAYLGGPDTQRQRQAGTEWGLDRLVDVLAGEAASLH